MRVPSAEEIRVLHVDDEPDFAELAATYLEREDERLTVETATSAGEGLDRLAEASFDCVVSDHDMPGQNGIEFLKTVRGDYPDLPFILFTGKGSEEVASGAISAGVSDYLRKQSGTERYELLSNRILNHVERTRAQRDLEESESHLKHAQTIANLGSWQADVVDDRMILSPEGREIFGIDEKEIDFAGFLACIHPDDRERAGDAWLAALDGAEYDLEYRIVAGEDESRWVRARADIEFDDDGRPIEALGVVQDITEHKQRQRRLREERDRREALFQNPSDAITEVVFEDDDLPIIKDTNETFTEIFEYDPGEVVGREVSDVLIPDDEEIVSQYEYLIDRVLHGEAVDAEVQRKTNGGTRDFRLRVFPFDVADGERGSYAIYTDITERKQRQRRLREERDKREALFQNPSDAIIEVEYEDEVPVIKDTNETFTEMFAYEPEDVVGEAVPDVLVPDEDETFSRFEDLSSRVLEGETIDAEVTRRTGAGPRNFRMRVFPFEIAGGERGSYAIYTDITERTERERELRRYETMANTAGDMVYILDDEGHMEFVNDAAERLTGYDTEDLVGEHVRLIMTDEDVARGRDLIQGLLRADESRLSDAFEWSLQTADGREVPCESHITLLHEDDEWVGTVGVVRDITERKKREERLENFTSIVSHDLRNPLNVAKGRLELAREDPGGDDLEKVGSALDRMETLIEDLLELARLENQTSGLDRVDLPAVTEDCWQHVATAEATLENEAVGSIRANRSRLQQLFENLVRNAVEHGGDDVTITVGDRPDEGAFYVADDGPGVPEAVRDEIFESGYTDQDGGTGIGLAIVEEVVEVVHDWDVAVTESEDGGARFEISGVEFVD